jgi:LacI family transcriptional regulator
LADLLNYSISNISKALSNSEEINSDKKLKIMKVVKEIGYTDSRASLPSNTKVVAMIPYLRNDFFAQVLNGLEGVEIENNFKIITGFFK